MPIETANTAPASAQEAATGQQASAADRLSFQSGVEALARLRGTATPAAPAPNQASPAPPQVNNQEETVDDDIEDTELTTTLDQDDDGEEQSETSEQQLEGTLRLPDGREVTVEEAAKGYMRQEDYTQKTQIVAERAVQLGQHEQIVAKGANYLLARLPQINELLKSRVPPAPPEDLRRTNPIDYWDRMNAHRMASEELAKAEAEFQNVFQYQQQLNESKQELNIAEENAKLLEKIPAWRKKETAKAEKAQVAKYARGLGFSSEEIARFDHRMVIALRDAALGDKVRKGGAQAKITRQGQPVAPSESRPFASGNRNPVSRQHQDLVSVATNPTVGKRDRMTAGAALLMNRTRG